DGIHDTEGAERVFRQRVLRDADDCSHHQPADLTTAHEREVDHHQQGHVQEFEEGKKDWNVEMEENRHQGDQYHYPRLEARDLPLPFTAEEDALVGIAHSCGGPPGAPAF